MDTITFRKSWFFRYTVFTVLTAFIGFVPVQPGYAQVAITMPPPGEMVHVTSHFAPPQMLGLKINLKSPFNFDFIMDQGEMPMSGDIKKEEFNKLIKYFLVSLTMPNHEMWVNLSPYESKRIIPEVFAQTEMGRDLLAQDYLLKQFTASLMYPEDGLGKKFWDKVYKQAQVRFGTTDINVNTFNKVWIVADHADVYQKDDTAFLVGSHLKVMLEQDYMAMEQNKEMFGNVPEVNAGDSKDAKTQMASQLVREIIIPAIEKEVNEGQSFAPVRQVYNAEILATWFKKTLKQSLLGQVFANQSKIAGQRVTDPQAAEKIYQQYLLAYKVGVYDYIRQDVTPDGQIIPRKYFSGGMREVLPEEVKVENSTQLTSEAATQAAQVGTGFEAAQRQGPESTASFINKTITQSNVNLTSFDVIKAISETPGLTDTQRATAMTNVIKETAPSVSMADLSNMLDQLSHTNTASMPAALAVIKNQKAAEAALNAPITAPTAQGLLTTMAQSPETSPAVQPLLIALTPASGVQKLVNNFATEEQNNPGLSVASAEFLPAQQTGPGSTTNLPVNQVARAEAAQTAVVKNIATLNANVSTAIAQANQSGETGMGTTFTNIQSEMSTATSAANEEKKLLDAAQKSSSTTEILADLGAAAQLESTAEAAITAASVNAAQAAVTNSPMAPEAQELDTQISSLSEQNSFAGADLKEAISAARTPSVPVSQAPATNLSENAARTILTQQGVAPEKLNEAATALQTLVSAAATGTTNSDNAKTAATTLTSAGVKPEIVAPIINEGRIPAQLFQPAAVAPAITVPEAQVREFLTQQGVPNERINAATIEAVQTLVSAAETGTTRSDNAQTAATTLTNAGVSQQTITPIVSEREVPAQLFQPAAEAPTITLPEAAVREFLTQQGVANERINAATIEAVQTLVSAAQTGTTRSDNAQTAATTLTSAGVKPEIISPIVVQREVPGQLLQATPETPTITLPEAAVREFLTQQGVANERINAATIEAVQTLVSAAQTGTTRSDNAQTAASILTKGGVSPEIITPIVTQREIPGQLLQATPEAPAINLPEAAVREFLTQQGVANERINAATIEAVQTLVSAAETGTTRSDNAQTAATTLTSAGVRPEIISPIVVQREVPGQLLQARPEAPTITLPEAAVREFLTQQGVANERINAATIEAVQTLISAAQTGTTRSDNAQTAATTLTSAGVRPEIISPIVVQREVPGQLLQARPEAPTINLPEAAVREFLTQQGVANERINAATIEAVQTLVSAAETGTTRSDNAQTAATTLTSAGVRPEIISPIIVQREVPGQLMQARPEAPIMNLPEAQVREFLTQQGVSNENLPAATTAMETVISAAALGTTNSEKAQSAAAFLTNSGVKPEFIAPIITERQVPVEVFQPAKTPGGINLSDENLTMNIKVDGSGMPLEAQYQNKAVMNIYGLTSVIRSIAPLTKENVPALYDLLK